MRARDLGITIGTLPTGPLNAITFHALQHDRLVVVMRRNGRLR